MQPVKFSKSSKIFSKDIVNDYIYLLAKFYSQMIYSSKDTLKKHSTSCANVHHDVTTFEVNRKC